jgi:hypothetical protein
MLLLSVIIPACFCQVVSEEVKALRHEARQNIRKVVKQSYNQLYKDKPLVESQFLENPQPNINIGQDDTVNAKETVILEDTNINQPKPINPQLVEVEEGQPRIVAEQNNDPANEKEEVVIVNDTNRVQPVTEEQIAEDQQQQIAIVEQYDPVKPKEKLVIPQDTQDDKGVIISIVIGGSLIMLAMYLYMHLHSKTMRPINFHLKVGSEATERPKAVYPRESYTRSESSVTTIYNDIFKSNDLGDEEECVEIDNIIYTDENSKSFTVSQLFQAVRMNSECSWDPYTLSVIGSDISNIGIKQMTI